MSESDIPLPKNPFSAALRHWSAWLDEGEDVPDTPRTDGTRRALLGGALASAVGGDPLLLEKVKQVSPALSGEALDQIMLLATGWTDIFKHGSQMMTGKAILSPEAILQKGTLSVEDIYASVKSWPNFYWTRGFPRNLRIETLLDPEKRRIVESVLPASKRYFPEEIAEMIPKLKMIVGAPGAMTMGEIADSYERTITLFGHKIMDGSVKLPADLNERFQVLHNLTTNIFWQGGRRDNEWLDIMDYLRHEQQRIRSEITVRQTTKFLKDIDQVHPMVDTLEKRRGHRVIAAVERLGGDAAQRYIIRPSHAYNPRLPVRIDDRLSPQVRAEIVNILADALMNSDNALEATVAHADPERGEVRVLTSDPALIRELERGSYEFLNI